MNTDAATTTPEVRVQSSDRSSLLRRLPWAISISFRQLLHVVLLRYFVAFVRFVWFVHVRQKLRVFNPDEGLVAEHTISHNRRGMVDLSVARSESLVRPISVIDRVAQEIEQAKVLSIGPRTEGELLNLWAYGFRWGNIQGLDLMSYSPRVDLGDMHALRYGDNTFDVIMFGWVLGYSHDPKKAANEAVRVAKPGAVIAIGQEHHPYSDEQVQKELGYLPGSDRSLVTTESILETFGDKVGTIYMRHDPEPARRDRLGSVVVIFSVNK